MGILPIGGVSVLESLFQRIADSLMKKILRLVFASGLSSGSLISVSRSPLAVSSSSMTITSASVNRFLLFASRIQFVGASSASFLDVNGLNTLSNSDSVSDAEGPGPLDEEVAADEGLGFPKKLAIIDLAFS